MCTHQYYLSAVNIKTLKKFSLLEYFLTEVFISYPFDDRFRRTGIIKVTRGHAHTLK